MRYNSKDHNERNVDHRRRAFTKREIERLREQEAWQDYDDEDDDYIHFMKGVNFRQYYRNKSQ